MIFFSESINGKVKENNEDSIAVIVKPNYCVAIVADGMGGASAGEIASKTTVDSLSRFLDENERRNVDKKYLSDAISYANKIVINKVRDDKTLKGMGSTLTFSCFDTKNIIVAQIGDSSAYLYNSASGDFKKITRDHLLIQKLIDSGRLTAEEAKTSPYKNIITRAIGFDDAIADYYTCGWSENDILMIFSDGLTNSVNNDDILAIISSDSGLQEKGERLIASALENGGRDNISVILAENSEGGGHYER